MDQRARGIAIASVAIGLFLLLSCDNTPTVPVPPPEMVMVMPPSSGVAMVVGPSGAASEDDVVLVFNEDQGIGVMTTAEKDGSFQTEIQATVGDLLIVQIKRDNILSREEAHEVPST